MRKMRTFIILFFILMLSVPCYSKEVPFTLDDRERLIRLEAKVIEMEKRIEQRFEQIDKRFEQIDKRFEQMEKQFDHIMTFMWMLVVIFSGITAATIGFAIWDRRTMIRPFEMKTKQIEREIEEERKKTEKLIEALRGVASNDEKVSEILRKFNLL